MFSGECSKVFEELLTVRKQNCLEIIIFDVNETCADSFAFGLQPTSGGIILSENLERKNYFYPYLFHVAHGLRNVQSHRYGPRHVLFHHFLSSMTKSEMIFCTAKNC